MGIDRRIAKSAIQKVNQELVEHLESCVSSSEEILTHLWGKGQDIQYNNGNNVRTVSLMPGLTAEDIAVTRGSNNELVIYAKDGQGRLTILDRFDASQLKQALRIEFADGSTIDLDPAKYYKFETSLPGKRLVKY